MKLIPVCEPQFTRIRGSVRERLKKTVINIFVMSVACDPFTSNNSKVAEPNLSATF